jgi:hypothetical protein
MGGLRLWDVPVDLIDAATVKTRWLPSSLTSMTTSRVSPFAGTVNLTLLPALAGV